MCPNIRHNAGNGRVAAEIVAASSNQDDGWLAPAALTPMVRMAIRTGSRARRVRWDGSDRSVAGSTSGEGATSTVVSDNGAPSGQGSHGIRVPWVESQPSVVGG